MRVSVANTKRRRALAKAVRFRALRLNGEMPPWPGYRFWPAGSGLVDMVEHGTGRVTTMAWPVLPRAA